MNAYQKPLETTLSPGQVAPRPSGMQPRSQAHPGVHPLTAFSHQGSQKFQPLPDPMGRPPYHYDLESVLPGIGAQSDAADRIVLHVVGDTGGIKNGEYQTEVAATMENDLSRANPPSFFYHLGDVVYFNGQISEYYSQFYEPYAHYSAPIIALAGNHDGDPIDSSQTSLDGWVRYFMTPAPTVNPESQDAPRATMQQPNVYFTLLAPFATFVGMYTNVPEHGSIDSVQQQWLTNELATADPNKALLVTLHHPIYSFDRYHSGSPRMADALQQAINDSRRVPNMVLMGHVHDYQRIERSLTGASPTPFLVLGNGGYHNLHGISLDSSQLPFADPATQASLIAFNATNHGYATLTIDGSNISGTVTTVDEGSHPGQAGADMFEYPAKAIYLPDSVNVSL